MTDLLHVPAWLGGAVVGAVIASLGYVAKLAIEQWRSISTVRAARLAALAELSALLRASRVSFQIQNAHAQHLTNTLLERQAVTGIDDGYEQTMTDAFPKFTAEERDLHSIIRSITIHAIRPVNQALLDWVRKDATFKGLAHKPGPYGDLASKLSDLEAHLLLWLAKYEAWIPEQAAHALVYLADEKAHGLGFPVGLDELVQHALGKRS